MRLILTLAMILTGAVDAAAQGGACSILTSDLVLAHSPASKQSKDLMLKIPPQEDTIGKTGSACQHGDVMLQINPFPMENFEAMFSRWTPVPGVGDKAFFRDNQGRWAELALVSGGKMITVQMDVPTGKKAADIQSNTIALAKAVLAKLK